MSVYQMQKCLFDYLHARKHGPPERKPDVSVEGYDLTDDEAARWFRSTWASSMRWAPIR